MVVGTGVIVVAIAGVIVAGIRVAVVDDIVVEVVTSLSTEADTAATGGGGFTPQGRVVFMVWLLSSTKLGIENG